MTAYGNACEELEREIARLNSSVSNLYGEAQALKSALQTIGQATISADTYGNVLEMNSVAEGLTGWREAEAIGQPLLNVMRIVNRESVAEFESQLSSVLLGGTILCEANHTLLNGRDGCEHRVSSCAVPIRNLSGEITGIELVFRDRTAELATQTALRESEERFRSTFDCSTVGKAITALGGEFIKVNQAFADMVGLTIEEMQRVNFSELTHPDDIAQGLECRRCLLSDERPVYRMDKRYRHRDGHLVFADVNITLLRDPAGAPRHFLTTALDITERKHAEEELRTSESLVKRILNNLQDAYIRADNDGRIIMVSPSAVDLYGYGSMQEMIGLPTEALYVSKEERRVFLEEFRQSGNLTDRIGLARRKDGAPFWVSLNARFFHDEQGQVAGAECFVRDISKRVEAEEALKEREAGHRTILRTAMDGFWLTDMNGRLLEVNDAYCRMSGYSAEQLLSMRIFDLEAAETADATAAHIKKVMACGGDCFETRHLRKDGSTFDVEVGVQFQPAAGGRLVIFSRDITERKQAEQALREKEFLLSESQHLGHVGSWMWDMKGPILWSDELYRLYGVSPDTFTPSLESLVGLIHPDDRSAMQGWIAACATADDPSELEFRVCAPDGTIRFIRGRGQAVRDAANAPVHMAGTAHDITDLKLAQTEQENLEAQLRVSQKMEAVGRLAGGVAHEFNNLLSVVLMYTGFAMEGASEDAPFKDDLLVVKNAAVKAAALTHQLLAFGRKQPMQPIALDLNKITADVENLLVRALGEDIELVRILAPDLGLTMADPSQIEHVLMNLAINAHDAMPGGGRLTIETSNLEINEGNASSHMAMNPGSYVELHVTDTGKGMDKKVRERIFEPFFTTKPTGTSTGLGLSTVYGIVKQSGGDIRVDSVLGQGTTVKIYLPRKLSPASAAGSRPSMLQRRSAGGETILLVEDEEALRSAAKRTLDAAGYKVLTAEDGNDALLTVAQHKGDVHLLLTDVVMQHMSGTALAEELSKVWPTLKILYVSGYTDKAAIVQDAVLAAGTQFLGKPFTKADLTRKVREVLDTT